MAMHEHDDEMKRLLGSPAMNVEPDPVRMQAARERMMHIASSPRHTNSVRRTALTIGVLLIGVSAIGVAATQTGRDFIRWVFTPVKPNYMVTHVATTQTSGSTNTWFGTRSDRPKMSGAMADYQTSAWSTSRSDRPFTDKEMADMKVQYAEMDRIKEAGGGRLAGFIEGPGHITFMVEYTLSDGTTVTVGQGIPAPKQKANMRVEEIMALRDAGAGVIISERPSAIGLGQYTIRFTLSDGQTVDLTTYFPPGTRQERERIFAETRELKQQLRFAVDDPRGPNSSGDIWGLLHYTLADGRTVGITEKVPKEALTPDGKQVAVPESEATKNGWQHLSPEQAEAEAIMEAGGGRLIALFEGPNPDGSSSQWTAFSVEFTLASGKTFGLCEGGLSEKQIANLRWDEISALRDAGAGQLLSQEPSDRGLGKYKVRFTLSDGQTVDLTVEYPPGTRQDREKIFAETRALKKQLRFTAEDLRGSQSGGDTWGLLRYTLADGRTVGITERIPKEGLSADGKHVAVPASGAP
jgi:hypothetical protein